MPIKIKPFDVAEHLADGDDQAFLIADALETGDAAFIRSTLNTVARARGMSQIAREAGVTREALYRALAPDGDPRMSTLMGVFEALGVKLSAIRDDSARTGQKHSITAVFDTRSQAEQAMAQLTSSGVLVSDMTLLPASGESISAADMGDGKGKDFWGSLEQLFGGTEDHATYAESIRRGGIMLSVRADDGHLDHVIDVLEQHGSVDLEEREETWRGEGWTVAGEDVLQVIEERLDVGKRAVSRGKVRLHSYVIENQVSENVTLRDEIVTVDRRAVDRPVAVLGADTFKERTIELEEIDEEAVVSKSARVVEEIGIRKDTTDRVETVRDTVRSTKVDIDDGRTGGVVAGAVSRFVDEVRDDMEVVGSDGVHVGTVDHVDGGRIKLRKLDPSAGGQHHYLSSDIIQSVAGKVMLAVTATEAKARWQSA